MQKTSGRKTTPNDGFPKSTLCNFSNTMKILFISKALPETYPGGIQTHVWELAKALAEKGQTISILTGGSWKRGIHQYKKEGIRVIELPYFPGRKLPFCQDLFEDLAFNVTCILWALRALHLFDVVHIQGRSGALLPVFFGSKNRFIITFHGLMETENRFVGRLGLGKKLHQWLAQLLEHIGFQRANSVIAVSKSLRNELQQRFGTAKPVHICTNGIPKRDFYPLASLQKIHLLFVGRLTRRKGLELLPQMLKSLGDQVRLRIVGQGPDRDWLLRQFVKVGVRQQVEFLGALPSEGVFHCIAKSHALVLPSYWESQGIVLMEANLCGKPVVASNLPSIQETITHRINGLLFPKGNVQAFTNAVQQLLDDRDLLQTLGQNGRDRMLEQFTWDKVADHVLGVYLGKS